MTTTKQAKIRVGLFACAAATLVVIVLVTFAGLHVFSKRDHYRVVFSDTVYGLEKGSLVYFNGIKVGTVSDIKMEPDDLRKVAIEITVDHDTPIHTDTTAELTMSGITGLKVVDLRGGSATTAMLEDGGQIPSKGGVFDKLQKAAENLADRTDELMAKVGTLVDRSIKVAENLDESSAALKGLITENKDALHHAITSIDTTVTGMGGQVNELVASAKKVMATADDTMTNVHGFVDGASSLVGEVGRVVKSNENQLAGTMADLRQASRNFKDLARELRDKPSRLLFSPGGSDRKLP